MDKELAALVRKAVRAGKDLDSLLNLVRITAIEEALVMSNGSACAAAIRLNANRKTLRKHMTHVPVLLEGTRQYKSNHWYKNRGEQPVDDYHVVQLEYVSGSLSKVDFASMFDWDSSTIKRWKVFE